jgi:hypothetical protein
MEAPGLSFLFRHRKCSDRRSTGTVVCTAESKTESSINRVAAMRITVLVDTGSWFERGGRRRTNGIG